mmetsp:Transcript_27979/g.60710  ORF Transcript_27979/g.60710 Transcript_27979/m.60710 type:complete len:120 (-) Transcript_27979:270-629(-)
MRIRMRMRAHTRVQVSKYGNEWRAARDNSNKEEREQRRQDKEEDEEDEDGKRRKRKHTKNRNVRNMLAKDSQEESKETKKQTRAGESWHKEAHRPTEAWLGQRRLQPLQETTARRTELN